MHELGKAPTWRLQTACQVAACTQMLLQSPVKHAGLPIWGLQGLHADAFLQVGLGVASTLPTICLHSP
jgi:hypothetical protein